VLTSHCVIGKVIRECISTAIVGTFSATHMKCGEHWYCYVVFKGKTHGNAYSAGLAYAFASLVVMLTDVSVKQSSLFSVVESWLIVWLPCCRPCQLSYDKSAINPHWFNVMVDVDWPRGQSRPASKLCKTKHAVVLHQLLISLIIHVTLLFFLPSVAYDPEVFQKLDWLQLLLLLLLLNLNVMTALV